MIGELTLVGDCLTVIPDGQTAPRTLVWPPDVSATVDGDAVTITTGLVFRDLTVVNLRLGERVFIGGGEVEILDDQLKASIPNGCPAPYWVPGGEIGPAPTPVP